MYHPGRGRLCVLVIGEFQVMDRKNSVIAVMLLLSVWLCRSAVAEPSASDFALAITELEARVPESGKTVDTLGTTRRGSAVIIDASGLMVTVGYLVLEAESIQVTFNTGQTAQAEVVANDHLTGLALLRTTLPEGVGSITLGRSQDIGVDEDVVVLKHGGTDSAHVTRIATVREFAGSWEYYIDRAFYTSPATRNFSGAALLNRDAKLVGIGSLLLSDINAGAGGQPRSGNLFIPIEHLSARLGELLTQGNSTQDKRPWLGVSLNESLPDLQVARVAAGSPAEFAGIEKDDAVLAINNKRLVTMKGFYQSLWDTGDAGVEVDLLISRGGEIKVITIETTSRDGWLAQ